jgi:N6-adenosine-specific RNA methylase IME4
MHLSKTESRELREYESIIERNLTAFYEVGNALVAIRDKRLYRASYSTFEEYCREKWGMGRAHAYRLIEAAAVTENLSPMGDKPITERQTRELSKLNPEHQRQAWQTAVETAPNGKVTAGHVRSVVNRMTDDERQAVKALSKEIMTQETGTRRADRIEKLAQTAAGNRSLNLPSRYPVIYCDPPWKYDHIQVDAWAVENHYPTMSTEEICELGLQIAQIITKDAILFLWATAPKLADAMKVIEAWDFTYKTCGIWDKVWTGMGNYFRIQHELLLIATRGNIPVPETDSRPASIVKHKRSTTHSEKPVVFYEIIEKMYPELPKIELFARSARDGWARWGNQVEVTV